MFECPQQLYLRHKYIIIGIIDIQPKVRSFILSTAECWSGAQSSECNYPSILKTIKTFITVVEYRRSVEVELTDHGQPTDTHSF
jgi:hypothetical protein